MHYTLHDLTAFPCVKLIAARCTPGFAEAWGKEMDALLAANQMFVVAFEPAAIAEEPEDYRKRAYWFKANRQTLAGRCAAMVAIVPSDEEREALAKDLVKRSRGFGVTYAAMASFDDAEAATPSLLANALAGHVDASASPTGPSRSAS